jgi:hypothetical protein
MQATAEQVTPRARYAAEAAAYILYSHLILSGPPRAGFSNAFHAARISALHAAWATAAPDTPLDEFDGVSRVPEIERAERAAQMALLRAIVGNPVVRRTVNPAWLDWQDGLIRRLAQAAYDEGAFDHLPILADALEEAGCTDEAILTHLRSPGPHVRGCWVVDLILARE